MTSCCTNGSCGHLTTIHNLKSYGVLYIYTSQVIVRLIFSLNTNLGMNRWMPNLLVHIWTLRTFPFLIPPPPLNAYITLGDNKMPHSGPRCAIVKEKDQMETLFHLLIRRCESVNNVMNNSSEAGIKGQ